MPYITEGQRLEIDRYLLQVFCVSPGELNYAITRLVKEYFDNSAKDYEAMNEIYGAMSLAAAEFLEKVIKPYERKKEAKNGSIYT